MEATVTNVIVSPKKSYRSIEREEGSVRKGVGMCIRTRGRKLKNAGGMGVEVRRSEE